MVAHYVASGVNAHIIVASSKKYDRQIKRKKEKLKANECDESNEKPKKDQTQQKKNEGKRGYLLTKKNRGLLQST